MLRGFLLVLLTLYAVLPPGVCACRLDALLWAALTEERLPECIDDPYEHDHHCPGAKKLFVQADQTYTQDPGFSTALPVSDLTPLLIRADVAALAFDPFDYDRPPLI